MKFFVILVTLLVSSYGFKLRIAKNEHSRLWTRNGPETSSEPNSGDVLKPIFKTAQALGVIGLGAMLTRGADAAVAIADSVGELTLPELQYPYNALEPYISERTMKIHHDKHHAKYVDTTKTMIKGTPMESMDLVSIIRKSHSDKNQGQYS